MVLLKQNAVNVQKCDICSCICQKVPIDRLSGEDKGRVCIKNVYKIPSAQPSVLACIDKSLSAPPCRQRVALRSDRTAALHWGHHMTNQPAHIPVLLPTVLEVLQPTEGDSVLDVTLGLGGHAEAFLEKIGDSGRFTGLDADTTNLELSRKRLERFGENIRLVHANFSRTGSLDLGTFDLIFADLGVSSPHFDDPTRGFSFRFDGPLDLRYDRSIGMTASDLIRASEDEQLAGIFCDYGELVREAGRLGRGLAGKDLQTTTELRALIEELFGYRAKQILPQVFQALRIAVNDEMGALRAFLDAAPQMLNPGGRLGVLSYHSLEDRMVKQTFRELCEPVKDDLTGQITVAAPFEPLTRKAIQATPEEVEKNPRSRSVRFRAVRRTV
jgi:16S rRNA (cytosine1402-N4)-methyltransferase